MIKPIIRIDCVVIKRERDNLETHALSGESAIQICKKINEIIDHINEKEKQEGKRMDMEKIIKMMQSEDFKERFKAEYWQLKDRYEKLHKMCIKYEAGTLDFTPNCSLELLTEQKRHMGNYLRCLEVRAEIEHVDLSEV